MGADASAVNDTVTVQLRPGAMLLQLCVAVNRGTGLLAVTATNWIDAWPSTGEVRLKLPLPVFVSVTRPVCARPAWPLMFSAVAHPR